MQLPLCHAAVPALPKEPALIQQPACLAGCHLIPLIVTQDPPPPLRHMTAINVMQSPVVGFDAIVLVSQVKAVLRRSTHNGFPVHTVRRATQNSWMADARDRAAALRNTGAACPTGKAYTLHV